MFNEIKAPVGWKFNHSFNYWQKSNGSLIAYISEISSGYQLLLFDNSHLNFSEQEIKTNDKSEDGYTKLFYLGESLLRGNSQAGKNYWV